MGILCIDVGGTFLKHTVIREDRLVGEVRKLATPRDTLDHLLLVIRQIYDMYQQVEGIAISAPGVINTEKGVMLTGGSLDYISNFPVTREVSRLCDGVPVCIENDAKAAASAEMYAGALMDADSGVVLTLGTAVGGTVMINRKIFRGRNLFAGELSYAIYHDDGTRDASWNLETNMWGCQCIPSKMVRLYGEPALSCEEILRRMKNNDKKARQVVRSVAGDVALLAHNLQCMFDPEVIAIGGGISSQKEYIQIIREETEKINHLFGGVVPMPVIKPCKYYNNANLLGAFYAFGYRQKSAA